jgi:hypothetical protein
METETYRNEGPLWPCGCLMGSPYCDCPDPDAPPRDLTLDDLAVIRSVGAMCTWEGHPWRWDGRHWQRAG